MKPTIQSIEDDTFDRWVARVNEYALRFFGISLDPFSESSENGLVFEYFLRGERPLRYLREVVVPELEVELSFSLEEIVTDSILWGDER